MVSLVPVLDADPMLTGRVQIADNGGADLLYWTGPAAERAVAVARMRALAQVVPGVHSVHEPASLSQPRFVCGRPAETRLASADESVGSQAEVWVSGVSASMSTSRVSVSAYMHANEMTAIAST